MWPPDARRGTTDRRRRPTAATLAALSVACVFTWALAARADGLDDGAPALREKDVRRAEKVLAKLRLLDAAAAAPGSARSLPDLAAELCPGLFITVAEMRQSDLKTDLDTAVFAYAEAARTWLTSGASPADCDRQRPDIYLPLCLELRGGAVRQLVISKARLHARWAEAAAKAYRGARDAETTRALSAMRAARERDTVIAARVVEELKTVEGLVGAAASDTEISAALGSAGALLHALPRGPAFYCLSNAWRSFKDGHFWYRKVRQSRSLVVSVNALDHDPLKDLRLDAAQVSRTVEANWGAAVRYTRLAERVVAVAAR